MELNLEDYETLQRMIGKIEGVAFAAEPRVTTPILDAIEVIDGVLERARDTHA